MGLLVNKHNQEFILANRNDIDEDLYSSLKNNEYHLFVKKEDFNLVFIACNDHGKSIKATFSSEGITSYNNSYFFQRVTLVKYLYDLEEEVSSLGKEALYNLYLPLGEAFASDLLLDEKTRREKLMVRDNFTSFLKDEDLDRFISNKGEIEQYNISYSFSRYEAEYNHYVNGLTIIINYDNNHKRTINNLEFFFSSFISNSIYEQGGKEFSTKKEYYSPLDYEILSLLARNSSGYRGDMYVDDDIFASFLLLYKGHIFSYNHEPSLIEAKEREEDFILDDNSEFLFTRYDEYISSDKYIFEYISHHFIIHHYKDPLLAKLAAHLSCYNEKEINYIHDLILETANKSINFRIKRSAGYNIHLYVDLTDKDELILETKYYLQEEEISKEQYLEINNNELFYNHYLKELERLNIKENGKIVNEGIILTFLTSSYTDLSRYCLLYLSSRIKNISKTTLPSITVSIKLENDWLGLDLGNEEFTKEEMEEILLAYKHKKKFFLVKDKLVTFNDNESLSSLIEMANDYDIKLEDLYNGHFPKYAYFSLLNYSDQNIKIAQNQYIEEFTSKLSSYLDTPLSLNDKTKANIRPYQEKGIKWLKTLYELNLGAILADDMGLGKSLQTVGLISEIKEDKPILIICPKSVTYNWANEIKLWGNSEEVVVLTDNKSLRQNKVKEIDNDKRVIYITSYDSLRNDLDFYENKSFSILVADEAQFIKNAYAKKAKAIKNIDAHFKLALTGTPIENSLSDLWSIFDLIMKGYLSSFDKFKNKYMSSEGMNEALRKKVSPFILRRIKDDVLKDLPKKEILVQTISMNEEERSLYDASLINAREKLKNSDTSFSMLPVLTSLREICVDPMVFYDGFKSLSSKFNFLLDVIPSALESGHKFLIFSSFASVLHHLEKVLDKANIKSYLIDGEVNALSRINYASNFNESNDINVMLVSLKAGGTGLNLHGADIVIHLDPWWNFASEEQATDRAHRIGQKRPVTVYKLIMHNSIEEKVMLLQEKKKELNQEIIGIDKDNSIKISKEDIKYLLS